MRKFTKVVILASFLLLAISLFAKNVDAQAAPLCYQENGLSHKIENWPACDYATLELYGNNMGGLSNPLGPGCYFWDNFAEPAQVVNCNDPQFKNAPAYGVSTPPPVSIDTAAENVEQEQGGGTTATGDVDPAKTDAVGPTGNSCGGSNNSVGTTVDLGCSKEGNPLNDLLFAAIRFLVAGVGVVVIASIIVGGIQYTTAQGEPQKQVAARGRIINAVIALLLYLLTFALMQWLIPGGIV